MNFKNHRILFGLSLAFLLSYSGCSDFLKGKPAKQEVLKVKIVDEACVSGFKSQLNKIAKSEASDQEINQVFDCVDKYMSQFQNKVEGEKSPEQFDAQDFLYITNRFFKDLNLSADAIQKMIHFKVALVGGSQDLVTKNEISALRTFFGQAVRNETLNLKKYFKIFISNKDEKTEASSLEISLAHQKLAESLKVLMDQSNLVESKYSYFDAKNLLGSLKVLGAEDKDLVLCIDRTRQLLLGDQVLNSKEEYRYFTENIVNAFELYTQSRFDHMKFEMASVQTTKVATAIVDKIVNLLSTSYQFNKTGRLSTHDLDGMLEVVVNRKMLPFDVQFKTLQEFYKVALKRIYGQETSEFITQKQFDAYARDAALFKLQIDFVENFQSKTYRIADIQKLLTSYMDTKLLNRLDGKVRTQDKALVKNNFKAMTADLYGSSPLMIKNDKYIISRGVQLESYSALDLLRSFYIKMWARQLLMGWGDGKSVSLFEKATVTEPQMDLFKKEFHQIGVELKLNDPRDPPSGTKSFLESNLFGFSSDGNDKMSMAEAFEYMHSAVADGAWSVTQFRNDLTESRCNLEEKDIFGEPWVREGCLLTVLKRNYPKYFVGKPELVKFLTRLTDVQFNEYYTLLMDMARYDEKNKNKKVETVDLQAFLVLTDYIETMFVKYDTNKNLALSAEEIRAGYPKFKNFATDYSYKHASDSLTKWDSTLNNCNLFYTKDELIRESFIFMALNKGREPEFKDMNYILCSVKGIYTHKNEIDRKSIIYTFLVLKSVLASKE